jgi:lipopolysaccharide export system protein LptC
LSYSSSVTVAPARAPARAGAFNAAHRHSRRVRFLKVAIPLLALCGGALFVFFAFFDPFSIKDVDVEVGTVSVSGDRLTMELPRLTGFNKNQGAYNVTAKTAMQRLSAPGIIDLVELEAVISMADKTSATLTATSGRFDSSSEFLNLAEKVKVVSTKGYSADLTSASIDFKTGTVKSEEPVKVAVASGMVNAGSLLVKEGGSVITFSGGVSTRFQAPPKNDGKAPVAGVSPAPEDQTR